MAKTSILQVPLSLTGLRFLWREKGPRGAAGFLLRRRLRSFTFRDGCCVIRKHNAVTLRIDPVARTVVKSADGDPRSYQAVKEHCQVHLDAAQRNLAGVPPVRDMIDQPEVPRFSFTMPYYDPDRRPVVNWQSRLAMVARHLTGLYDQLTLRGQPADLDQDVEHSELILSVFVHGDVHGENIRLDDRGQTILIDWSEGIAPFMHELLRIEAYRRTHRGELEQVLFDRRRRLSDTFADGCYPIFRNWATARVGCDEERWLKPNLLATLLRLHRRCTEKARRGHELNMTERFVTRVLRDYLPTTPAGQQR